MLNFQTFSAWVVIDGQTADVFNVEHNDVRGTMHVTCWLPSEAGKNFEVHFRDLSGSPSCAQVYIDGNRCAGRVLKGSKKSIHAVTGLRISPSVIRPFVFSKLDFTEDEDTLDTLASLSKVGQVEVNFYFVTVLGKDKPRFYEAHPEHKVNEKAKKGIDHQTRFGEAKNITKQVNYVKTKRMGKDVVKFVFRYRPLEVLRAQGIAPQPSASSSQSTKKRQADNQEDVKPRNLGIIVILDSEDEEQAHQPKKRIKKDIKHEVKREPTSLLVSGEVIDLT
ncbi:hypothetical protein F5050DRAFT_1807176 [Lentinula boryana]|uniref:DUF7918 domain-containing protein n=1 Tax=Lentinula boryana TaxID=40481 RepID=A0ABQ8QEY7_9AGAR|nr:hypothetical protein F5050DRAFT_1807176 [Lentinula boryana]